MTPFFSSGPSGNSGGNAGRDAADMTGDRARPVQESRYARKDPMQPTEPGAAPMSKMRIWMHGVIAAVISGGANGVITGYAAIGIDPSHFNLATGFSHTLSLAGASSVMSAIIGVAAYLKQSPLPDS